MSMRSAGRAANLVLFTYWAVSGKQCSFTQALNILRQIRSNKSAWRVVGGNLERGGSAGAHI